MNVSLQQTGGFGRVFMLLCLGLCGAAQAGMQVQAEPLAEPKPKEAPAASKPRATAVPAQAATSRPDEKIAWSPCIRLINAAAMGAISEIEWRQTLLEHCAS